MLIVVRPVEFVAQQLCADLLQKNGVNGLKGLGVEREIGGGVDLQESAVHAAPEHDDAYGRGLSIAAQG